MKPGFIPFAAESMPTEVPVRHDPSNVTERKMIERFALYLVTDAAGYIIVATTDEHHAKSVKRDGERLVEHEAWMEIDINLPYKDAT